MLSILTACTKKADSSENLSETSSENLSESSNETESSQTEIKKVHTPISLEENYFNKEFNDFVVQENLDEKLIPLMDRACDLYSRPVR